MWLVLYYFFKYFIDKVEWGCVWFFGNVFDSLLCLYVGTCLVLYCVFMHFIDEVQKGTCAFNFFFFSLSTLLIK